MPSTDTITSTDLVTAVARTKIKSADFNSTISVFRGHLLPVNATTSSAADLTWDMGSYTYSWRRGHLQELILNDLAATPSNPTSGFYKIYAKTDGKVYKLDSTGTETNIGSGAGGINYIDNPDAEGGTTGYATYADAAATSPVDGTGGSPTVTWTRTTSTPLRDTGSFLLTKDAANRQGEGASYDFTIDDADKCKVLTFTFDYEIPSGTYASGDVTLWIYDVTNSTLIQPAGTSVANVGVESKHIATFQATTSTSYRAIWHVSSTSASAYTMKIDNVVVGPQTVQYGAPVTDWTSYTPTIAGCGTVTISYAQWKRIGDTMLIRTTWTCGTVAASAIKVSLPTGYTISGALDTVLTGSFITDYTGATQAGMFPIFLSADTSNVQVGKNNSASGFTAILGNAVNSNGSVCSLTAMVPITGWSSSVQMSNDTDTRVVAAKYSSAAAQSISTDTTTALTHATKVFDTHNAVSAGSFTVPVPGYYRVSAHALFASSAAWTSGETGQLYAYVNGSLAAGGQIAYHWVETTGTHFIDVKGSTIVSVNAGDVITVRIRQSSGSSIALLNDADTNWIMFERLSGPSAIAATETVTARYNTNTAQNLVTDTILDFEDKVYDSHGSVTTGASWKFTAPVSGTFRVNARVTTGAATAAAITNTLGLRLAKNGTGSTYVGLIKAVTTSSLDKCIWGSAEIKLLAGDYINLLGLNTTTQTHALDGGADENYIEITRVGNY